MQSLWSRAGCGCRGCLQVAGGMTRQTTTRVARRKPTFSEVFTAFYTTIMGTAALLDARQKDIRRDDLNRQIDEVKADLDRLMKENAAEPYSDTGHKPPPGDIHNRYRSCWEKGVQHGHMADFLDTLGDPSNWHKTPPQSTEVKALWRSVSLPRIEKSIVEGKKTDYDYLLRLLDQEESELYLKHRMPRNAKQLRVSEKATRGLVAQLLRAIGIETSVRGGYKALCKPDYTPLRRGLKDSSPSVQSLWHLYHVRFLDNRGPYRGPCYPSYTSRSSDANGKHELHDAFRAILDVQGNSTGPLDPKDIKERVLKICHNLLVSSDPPTVHTLCTLLIGFDRLGHHDLANAVAMNLRYSTKLEPTQLTLMCLFNHYKERGEIDRIHRLILRCTGDDPRGVNIRSKSAEVVHADDYLQRWARLDKVVFRDGVYVERAWFSSRLVDTIVHGMLSLDRLQQAVAIFAQSRDDGIKLCSRTLLLLLDQCLYALDRTAATKILNTLRRSGRIVDAQTSAEKCKMIYERIQALYDLCVSRPAGRRLLSLSETQGVTSDLRAQQVKQSNMYFMVLNRKVDDAAHDVGRLRARCLEQMASFAAERKQHVNETKDAEEVEQEELARGAPRQQLLEFNAYRGARAPAALITHQTGRLDQLSEACGI